MFEPEELMARIVDLEEQLKVSEMAPPVAEQLIACLEGEIAKRDERIVEIELEVALRDQALDRHVEYGKELRAELAAIKAQDTVGEVVGWYRLDRPYEMTSYQSVCATWHRLGAPVAPLYAAPVSEAKAQGSMLQKIGKRLAELLDEDQFAEVEQMLASLNAATVQQVSVPDGWKSVPVEATPEMLVIGHKFRCDSANGIGEIYRQMLAAAPAAPAADAVLVDEQAEFESWITQEAGPDAAKRWPTATGPCYENCRVQDYRTGWVECIRRMSLAAHRPVAPAPGGE